MSDKLTQIDINLWADYGAKLKNTFAQGPLGPEDRFYIAPLSSAGIAGGNQIGKPITNNGIHAVSDALLDLDSPVFVPSNQSFFQRASLYCTSVELNSDKSPGLVFAYNEAAQDLVKARTDYDVVLKSARAAYNEASELGETTLKFKDWATENFSELGSKADNVKSKSQVLRDIQQQMDGDNAKQLAQFNDRLTQAESLDANSYNMVCTPASANQVGRNQTGEITTTFSRPSYTLDAQYNDIVDGWIRLYPQNSKNPAKITFSAKDASQSTWKDLGFSSSSVSVTGSYCVFFRATYRENNQTVTSYITAEKAGADLEVTLTYTNAQTFTVTPGAWNPSTLWGMPLRDQAVEELRRPKAYVTQVVMAYGVGMTMELKGETQREVDNYIKKASETGGSASIFGYNIGLGGDYQSSQTSTVTFDELKKASTGTTLNIPSSNNAYPTLLAVIGKKIPDPPA